MTAALHNTSRLVGYGAVELKRLAGRHAFYGLFLSVGIIGAVFLLFFLVTSVLSLGHHTVVDRYVLPPIVLPPPIVEAEKDVSAQDIAPAAPKGETAEGGVSKAIVEPVAPAISSISHEIPISTPVFTKEEFGGVNNNPLGDPSATMGGISLGGNSLGGIGSGSDTAANNSGDGLDWEEVPDILPQVDMQQLQNSIVYPELALRRELEGKVVVSVLIDTEGRVTGSSIVQSTHAVFNDAALKAVYKSSFTPAFRNGKPVSFRLFIPVTFQMRR